MQVSSKVSSKDIIYCFSSGWPTHEMEILFWKLGVHIFKVEIKNWTDETSNHWVDCWARLASPSHHNHEKTGKLGVDL